MKSIIVMCLLLVVFAMKPVAALSASGKCTVVKVDGKRMVLQCNEQTKGFAKGSQIKIKTDNNVDRKK